MEMNLANDGLTDSFLFKEAFENRLGLGLILSRVIF